MALRENPDSPGVWVAPNGYPTIHTANGNPAQVLILTHPTVTRC